MVWVAILLFRSVLCAFSISGNSDLRRHFLFPLHLRPIAVFRSTLVNFRFRSATLFPFSVFEITFFPFSTWGEKCPFPDFYKQATPLKITVAS